MKPIMNDVRTVTTMENLASFELPRPSSFETRTLVFFNQNIERKTNQMSSVLCIN